MKYLSVLAFVLFFSHKALSLSLDEKVRADRKVWTFASFEEAEQKGIISGVFYDVGGEKGFEELRFSKELSVLGPSCEVKGYVMGYNDIEKPLFISSLPKSSAGEFTKRLNELKFNYIVKASLVIDFSESCKQNDSFPDAVVIHLNGEEQE